MFVQPASIRRITSSCWMIASRYFDMIRDKIINIVNITYDKENDRKDDTGNNVILFSIHDK